MKISIKNMVCPRCISTVQQIFDAHHISISSIVLGEVTTENNVDDSDFLMIRNQLEKNGFEILENPIKIKIDRVKTLLIEKVASLDIDVDFSLSNFISENLNSDYSHISKLFSQSENYTIEKFFILQKIEKVKELLSYHELTLTEISHQLGYKSVQHLSNQFRKIENLSPSQFQKSQLKMRVDLDKI